MIEEGANINCKNNKDYRSLIYASKYGPINITRCIIKKMLQDYEKLNKIISKDLIINKEEVQTKIYNNIGLLKSLLFLPLDCSM